MKKRRYVILDVFTDKRLAGNPLAVVLDAGGLDAAAMQAIAREFSLSETVFVLPDPAGLHRALLRIFTPATELPFAGHPTVGTAFLLGALDSHGKTDALTFGLKEEVGTISCAVDVESADKGFAHFALPKFASRWGTGRDIIDCAWALGLEPKDIGFERHEPSRYSAGTPFDLVPLASLDALARARVNPDAFPKVFGDGAHVAAFLYCRDGGPAQKRFRARMFGFGLGIAEDPATGSAVAALSGALMQFEPMGEGQHVFAIGQGYEMGRPSEIALKLVIDKGVLTFADIGGAAVVVARGELLV